MFLLWSMFAFLLVGWAWPKSHWTCKDMSEALKFGCTHLPYRLWEKALGKHIFRKIPTRIFVFCTLKNHLPLRLPQEKKNTHFPRKTNHWTEGGWGLCICHPCRKTTSDGGETRLRPRRWFQQFSLAGAGEKGFLWTFLKKMLATDILFNFRLNITIIHVTLPWQWWAQEPFNHVGRERFTVLDRFLPQHFLRFPSAQKAKLRVLET